MRNQFYGKFFTSNRRCRVHLWQPRTNVFFHPVHVKIGNSSHSKLLRHVRVHQKQISKGVRSKWTWCRKARACYYFQVLNFRYNFLINHRGLVCPCSILVLFLTSWNTLTKFARKSGEHSVYFKSTQLLANSVFFIKSNLHFHYVCA